MSSSNIKRTKTGIHTVEGNQAGSRAGRLAAKRLKQQEEYNKKREQIEAKHNLINVKSMDSKFKVKKRGPEDVFKAQTVGMVTLDQYRVAKAGLAAAKDVEKEKGKKRKKKKKKKKKLSKLSFGGDDNDDFGDEESPSKKEQKKKKKKIFSNFGKNPEVNTDFLPDRDRDAASDTLRQKFSVEWHGIQGKIKDEQLEVTFSYWDGSGHRRDIVVTKGTTIGRFVELVRLDLLSEFPELRGVTAENLLYIKEDLIIPQHYSFYDLIITKARGKSGPLFHFDVHDDIRMVNDVRIEKDESHPGKIVARAWFERNKHIFPASRWEVYDPSVKRDNYTIHGNEVRGGEKAAVDIDGEEIENCVAMAGIWSVGANL